eukprot:COSAG06_NODE_692_length_13043_cov_369.439509_4_plen_103_part_00
MEQGKEPDHMVAIFNGAPNEHLAVFVYYVNVIFINFVLNLNQFSERILLIYIRNDNYDNMMVIVNTFDGFHVLLSSILCVMFTSGKMVIHKVRKRHFCPLFI